MELDMRYDEKGKIIYKINNGNGYVKEYHPNRNIKYEGEYKNVKKKKKEKE